MSNNLILKDFGIHLKNIRVQKNITQEQLAHLCELDRTYISGIERGKRNISLINLLVFVGVQMFASCPRLLKV